MAILSKKLKKARNAKGATQDELAAATGVTRSAVAQWEAGTVYPRMEKLKKAAEFLGVEISLLLSPSTESTETEIVSSSGDYAKMIDIIRAKTKDELGIVLSDDQLLRWLVKRAGISIDWESYDV